MKARALLNTLAEEADLRLLRIFVAIAESGGLAAAELRLNISRSVISRHLMTWRRGSACGCANAAALGLCADREGATVLDATRRLFSQIEGFRREVTGLHGDMRGELNLAVFDKFVTNPGCHLAEAIAAFGAAAPG